LLGAGLAGGLSAVGPGMGAGLAAASACAATGRRPDLSATLVRTMLVGQAVSQSTSVYGLVVALLLLYVV
ncbi:MAG: ATP synthase F0 subunit C, partial [Thermodesulfobacteriota bacterium]